jgi:hypothetical protein
MKTTLTPEENRIKRQWAKKGVEIEFSDKPFVPNMKYHDYLVSKR